LFLANLRLHLTHFPGQHATAALPMATWPGPREQTWNALTNALGISESPAVGERLDVTADEAPALGGTIIEVGVAQVTLLLDKPAPGTAFIAAEGNGDEVRVSLWSYLYGDEGVVAAKRDEPLWQDWLDTHGS
jgi:hypothetical protein